METAASAFCWRQPRAVEEEERAIRTKRRVEGYFGEKFCGCRNRRMLGIPVILLLGNGVKDKARWGGTTTSAGSTGKYLLNSRRKVIPSERKVRRN